MRRFTGVARTAVAAIAASLAGCNDSVKQKTYPTTGQVLLDGKPVPGAMVVFHPTDKTAFKWDERPQGRTDADGRFAAFTYQEGDGVPAGEYRVAVAVAVADDDNGNDQVKRAKTKPLVPSRYGHQDKSGLTAKVDAGPTTLPAFELTTK